MDRNSKYYKQAQLLLRVLPLIAEEDCFALKGGTAINLFVRDFPRLSVDIDLVYLPDGSREQALAAIALALNRITESVEEILSPVDVVRDYPGKPDALRLLVRKNGVTIKVELSPVMRGTVYAPEVRAVVPLVEEELGYAEMKVVAMEDLYAGKLCAAFARQHPRDFFDVMLLLENEGITEEMRKAFLVYLASNDKPMEEVLSPRWIGLDAVYRDEFQGMSPRATSAEELLMAGQRALDVILSSMTQAEKKFLCSLYEGSPEWSASGLAGIERLPSLQWKLININKMTAQKRQTALSSLKAVLAIRES
jgi:predicted nucleotidyltransferase component of viral defense system